MYIYIYISVARELGSLSAAETDTAPPELVAQIRYIDRYR